MIVVMSEVLMMSSAMCSSVESLFFHCSASTDMEFWSLLDSLTFPYFISVRFLFSIRHSPGPECVKI